MMMNKMASDFVNSLFASVTGKTDKDQRALYTNKLGRWKLTSAQWNKVLDHIIENNQSGYLPPLPYIYDVLKKQIDEDSDFNLGMMYFEINGNPNNACRVKVVDGEWVHAIGPKAGMKPNFPAGAIVYKTEPDNKADPDPRDQYGPDEISALIDKVTDDLTRLGRRK